MANNLCSHKNVTTDKYILTFGYGNRNNYEEFFQYLAEYNVICVIDVRLSPRAWTQRWYGKIIEKICHEKNIQYLSEVSLGNTSGNSNWIPPDDEKAQDALEEVSKIAENGSILLLCAEKQSNRCHRVDVAKHLQKLVNSPIKHLD